MKKLIQLLLGFSLILSSVKMIGQINPQNTTPNGMFDIVYDRLGVAYSLANLNMHSGKPIGGSFIVSSVPTNSCSAGYFNLYFAPLSIFSSSPQAQTAICQVFKDISSFLISPLSPSAGVGPKINIYCDNTIGLLATASSFYVFPSNPTNPNQGIVDGQIYKAIVSGTDPYLNIPVNYTNAANYYHGFVAISVSGVFDYGLGTPTNIAAYDFYSVMLHEVTHALGFASLIDVNGFSKFGSSNNYFSRYDKFLQNASGNYLLGSSSSCNPNSNLTYTLPLSSISTSTSGCITDITTCSSAARFAGNTYTESAASNQH